MIALIIHFIITKQMVSQLMGTMWDHMDGRAKQYRCASAIYLL